MNKQLSTLCLCAALSLSLLTGCATQPQSPAKPEQKPAETQSSKEGEHVFSDADPAEATLDYIAEYHLQPGVYKFQFGHTHERFVFLVTAGPYQDFTKDGIQQQISDTFSHGEETKVKQQDNIVFADKKVYYLPMAHYNGFVTIEIATEGNYAFGFSQRPGSKLPVELEGKDGYPVAVQHEVFID